MQFFWWNVRMCCKTRFILMSTFSVCVMGRSKRPFFFPIFFMSLLTLPGNLIPTPISCSPDFRQGCYVIRLLIPVFFTVCYFVLLLELRLESWAPSPGHSVRDPQKSWCRAGKGVSGRSFQFHPRTCTPAARAIRKVSVYLLESLRIS